MSKIYSEEEDYWNNLTLWSIITSIWHFITHFNLAEDIEWDGRTYEE